jgi:hypothetical protein
MVMTGISGSERQSHFDKFTIANQANKQDNSESYWLWLQVKIVDAKAAGDIVIFTDIFYSLAFALFIIIINRQFHNKIDSAEYELTFMNDYSVEIQGLPSNGVSHLQLKLFLESFSGKVLEISYARYYGGMLADYK